MKYKKQLLASFALVSLLSSPLIGSPLLRFIVRSTGFTAGLTVSLAKTEEEETYLEKESRRLQEERDELTKQYLKDTEDLELWVDAEQKRLTDDANRLFEEKKGSYEEAIDEVLGELEVAIAENNELKERLLCYQLPQLPQGTSRIEVISARTIEFFYQRGLLADYRDSWTEDNHDLIRIKSRSGTVEPFRKLLEELQVELGLDVIPSLTLTQGCIQIKLNTTNVDTRDKPSVAKVKEPSGSYLKDAVISAPSFRINGESGSGKSTLAMNLIHEIRQELNTDNVVLIDPKYPLSEWDITPKFKGIEEAFDGLTEAADLIETRLKLAREDKDSGKKLRTFKPVLYVIDEIDWVISHYGIEAATVLRTTLKVGRALNVMILYIGQTPLCSRLKMNRDDFRHSASFFLGENIPAGINENVHNAAIKSDLETQYSLRQAGNNKYFCMVKQPGKTAFIGSLPKPYFEPISCKQNDVNPCKSEENDVNVVSEDVNNEFTEIYSDNFKENAEKALKQGMRKSEIIQKVWGMSGREYAEGKILWDKLEISTETI